MEKHISEDQKQLLAGLTSLSFWPQQQPKKVKKGKRKYTNILCEPYKITKLFF